MRSMGDWIVGLIRFSGARESPVSAVVKDKVGRKVCMVCVNA